MNIILNSQLTLISYTERYTNC